jgi:hypothetical protein
LAVSATSGSVAAGTAKVGIVTAGAVKAATLTEADHVAVVNQAFTLALVVDRQLGVPPVTGTAPSVSVPAGITGIQVAGRQGVPSVADRQPRVACDRKNISAHFVAAALVARQRHPRQRRDRGSRSKLPDSWPGVSEVVFTSMTMSDNSASIVARAHEWTKSVLRQQGATIGSTRLPQESRTPDIATG